MIPCEIVHELDLKKSGRGWRGACKLCGKEGPPEVLAGYKKGAPLVSLAVLH